MDKENLTMLNTLEENLEDNLTMIVSLEDNLEEYKYHPFDGRLLPCYSGDCKVNSELSNLNTPYESNSNYTSYLRGIFAIILA